MTLDDALSEGPAAKLKEAEDFCAMMLHGGACAESLHRPATRLRLLVTLRELKLLLPHVSTNPVDLEQLIRQEAKKLA